MNVTDNEYSEKEMGYYFSYPVKKKKYVYDKTKDKEGMLNPENWDRIFSLNRITNGNRNNEFCRIILWLKDEEFSKDEIENVIWEMNSRINPLPESEIRALLRGKL